MQSLFYNNEKSDASFSKGEVKNDSRQLPRGEMKPTVMLQRSSLPGEKSASYEPTDEWTDRLETWSSSVYMDVYTGAWKNLGENNTLQEGWWNFWEIRVQFTCV